MRGGDWNVSARVWHECGEDVERSDWSGWGEGAVCGNYVPTEPGQDPSHLQLSLPWDWLSTNLGEILHIGCPSIAAWIYIFGGAGPGFEPGTALQQSGVLTSRPRLTPNNPFTTYQ